MTDGPLAGIRIIELGGIGPGPYAGMVLADMGAEVIKVDQVGGRPALFPAPRATEILDRGKRSIEVNLKDALGRDAVLGLVAGSEAVIEGFRPGVTERLGIGPAEALAANPALVYGRVTGWGQTGPLSDTAGHDIDYLAVAGALGAIGGADPEIPLNLVADFGGGGMFLVAGLLAGVLAARSTGVGTVVDAAMVDGVAHLTSMMHGGMAAGWWTPQRSSNPLDGGAPFYAVYRTSDGQHVAVGALEPQFFGDLIDGLGIDAIWAERQYDMTRWDELRRVIGATFLAQSREHWTGVFETRDACVAPVLSLDEAPNHRHMRERGVFTSVDGVRQPMPAPRFSGYGPTVGPPPLSGDDTANILDEMGYTADQVADLRSKGVIG